MFPGFWTSAAFEILIPLVLTSTLFWAVIMPKALAQTLSVTDTMIGTLHVPPCNTLLQWSLKNLVDTRAGISRNTSSSTKDLVLATNIVIIMFVAVCAIAIPILQRLSLLEVRDIFLEITAIYVLVLVAEIYFIKEIAFKYYPSPGNDAFKEVVANLATTCFDVKLAAATTVQTTC